MSKKYYFLKRGDIIQEGDEYKGYNPDCTKTIWIKLTKKYYSNVIGLRRTCFMSKMRRKK